MSMLLPLRPPLLLPLLPLLLLQHIWQSPRSGAQPQPSCLVKEMMTS
jgi:hypothetical protein